MRRLVIYVALAAGCHEPELSKLEAVKREVCACATVACGEAAVKKAPAGGTAGTASHRDQLTARGIVGCLARLYEAAAVPEADDAAADPSLPQ